MPRRLAVARARKHGDHDQSEHGNWATGGAARQDTVPVEKVRDIIMSSRYGATAIRKISDLLGKPSKPTVGQIPEGAKVVYRGFGKMSGQSSDKAISDFLDGTEAKSNDRERADTYYTTWGDGIYATPYEDSARNYGEVLRMAISPDAKMVTSEQQWGSAAQHVGISYDDFTSDSKYVGNMSSIYNAYWASQGYDGADFGSEIVLFNAGALIVDESSLPAAKKSLKHGDHDQSEHGNWATGGGFKAPDTATVQTVRDAVGGSAKTTMPSGSNLESRAATLTDYTYGKNMDGEPIHAAMNEQLRAGKTVVQAATIVYEGMEDPDATSNWRDLDIEIRNNVFLEDTTLYRGSSPILDRVDLEAGMRGEGINLYGMQITPGTVVSDAAYVSTSKYDGTNGQEYFKQNWGDLSGLMDFQAPASVSWRIKAPAGSPGLDLTSAQFQGEFAEDEVLLPRNTHMVIDKVNVTTQGSGDSLTGIIEIDATIVPTHETSKSVKHEAGPDHDQDDHGNWARGMMTPELKGRISATVQELGDYRGDPQDVEDRVQRLMEQEKMTEDEARTLEAQNQMEFIERRTAAITGAIPEIVKNVSDFREAGGTFDGLDADRSETTVAERIEIEEKMDALQAEINALEPGTNVNIMLRALSQEGTQPEETELIVARDADGKLAGVMALNGTYVEYLGSTGTLPGTGSALMFEAMQLANGAGDSGLSLESVPQAQNFYEKKLGLANINDEMNQEGYYGDNWSGSGTHKLSPGELNLIVDYVEEMLPKGASKSVKHGDHDQSEHGNWATGGSVEIIDTPRPQWEALQSYTGQEYLRVNQALRNPEIADAQERAGIREKTLEVQRNMDALFAAQAPTTQDMTVYRGLSGTVVSTLQEGTVWTDGAYMSTSQNPFEAANFAGLGPAYFSGQKAILEVTIPAGSKVIAVDDYAKQFGFDFLTENEKEILLPRGTSLRVDSVEDANRYDESLLPEEDHTKKIRVTVIQDDAVKSTKHGDHDQSEHGNWATGGGVAGTPYDPSGEAPEDSSDSDLGTAQQYVRRPSPDGKYEFNPTQLVDRYSWNGYVGMNAYLRSTDGLYSAGTETETQAVRSMSDDLAELVRSQQPLAQDTMLYRGGRAIWFDGEPGQIFADPGFSSTSLNEKTAFRFAGGAIDEGIPTLFRITAPAGTQALNVSEYQSRDRKEEEMLLPPGTAIRVDNVTTEKRTIPDPYGLLSSSTYESDVRIVDATIVAEPIKSTKHGDHDQSDHGSWAHGDALDKFVKPARVDMYQAIAERKWKEGYYTQFSDEDDLANANLTKPQAAAVLEYAQQHYAELNGLLRGEDMGVTHISKEQQATRMTMLDQAIAANSLEEDTTLYRGAGLARQTHDRLIADLVPGGVYTDPAFGSTTTDQSIAGGFASGLIAGETYGIDYQVRWEINAPEGSNALSVTDLVPDSREAEVLLPRNSHYRVDSIQTKPMPANAVGVGITTIKVTLLPTESTKSTKHEAGPDHDQLDHGNWATGARASAYDPATDKPPAGPFESDSATTWRKVTLPGAQEVLFNWQRGLSDVEDKDGNLMEVHRVWNRELRDGASIRSLGIQAEVFDKLVNSNVLREDTTLYRGLASGWDSVEEANTFGEALEAAKAAGGSMDSLTIPGYGELKVGGVVADGGFLSTSKSEYAADRFADTRYEQSPTGFTATMVWNIQAPAGSSALDLVGSGGQEELFVDAFDRESAEQEVILPRNTHLEITGISVGAEDTIKVDAKIVTAATATAKSVKHGDHDQEDHGNWARGGQAYSAGKWVGAGDKAAMEHRSDLVDKLWADRANMLESVSYLEPDRLREILEKETRYPNGGTPTVHTNGQVTVVVDEKRSAQSTDAFIQLTDRAMAMMPEKMANDSQYPIEFAERSAAMSGLVMPNGGFANTMTDIEGHGGAIITWSPELNDARGYEPLKSFEPTPGWWAASETNVAAREYMMAHEVGHAVLDYAADRRDDPYGANYAQQVVRAFLGGQANSYAEAKPENEKLAISKYGTQGWHEFYAEHFAAWQFDKGNELTEFLAKQDDWRKP